jgi:hypothetical protein
MRCAFFVIPVYTILFYVSVAAADTIFGMEFFVSIVEAYAFWNLFAMMVSNLGGPQGTLKTINYLDTQPNNRIIKCMCFSAPALYMRLVWALRYFSSVRVFFVFLFSVFSYSGNARLAMVCNAAGAGLVAYTFTTFLAFCKYLLCV